MLKKENNKLNKKKNQLYYYSKYSSIAFQMIAIILVGVFGGIKLDELVSWEFPVFTLVLTILSVFLSMYYVIKDLLK